MFIFIIAYSFQKIKRFFYIFMFCFSTIKKRHPAKKQVPSSPLLFSIAHFFPFVKRKLVIYYNFCFFYKN